MILLSELRRPYESLPTMSAADQERIVAATRAAMVPPETPPSLIDEQNTELTPEQEKRYRADNDRYGWGLEHQVDYRGLWRDELKEGAVQWDPSGEVPEKYRKVQPEPELPPPAIRRLPREPGTLEGFFDGFKAVPAALMQAGANFSQLGAENSDLTGFVAFMQEKYGFDTGGEYMEKLRSYRLARRAEEQREYIREHWEPDPERTGFAGQVVYGFLNMISRVGIYTALTHNPTAGLALASADYGYGERNRLIDEGVDPDIAARVGWTSGLLNFVGLKLPAAWGRTWLRSMFYGAGVNAVADSSEVLAVNYILSKAGYEEIADRYQITPVTLAVSAALGGLFGRIGWRDPRIREAVKERAREMAQRQAGIDARTEELAPEYRKDIEPVLSDFDRRAGEVLPRYRKRLEALAHPEGGKEADPKLIDAAAKAFARYQAVMEDTLGVKNLPRVLFNSDMDKVMERLGEAAKSAMIPMGPAIRDAKAVLDVLPLQAETRSQRKVKVDVQRALAGDEGKNAAPYAGVLNEETGLRLKAGREVVAGLFSTRRADSPFLSKYVGSLPDIVSRARRLESSYRGAETSHVFGAVVQGGGERHWVTIRAKEADSRPGLLDIEDINVRLLDGNAPLPKEGEKLTQPLFDILWDKEHPENTYVRADGAYYFTYIPEGAFREGGTYYRPSRPAELYQARRPKAGTDKDENGRPYVSPEEEEVIKGLGLPEAMEKDLRTAIARKKAIYRSGPLRPLFYMPDEGFIELRLVGVEKDEGKIKLDSDGSPIPKFEKHQYDFLDKNPANPTGELIEEGGAEYNERVKKTALKIFEELAAVISRAKEGDPDAEEILKNVSWYYGHLLLLRNAYGAFGNKLAELLGATSPQTPVRTNEKFSVEASKRFWRGDFDEALLAWFKHDEKQAPLRKDLSDYVDSKRSGLTDADIEELGRLGKKPLSKKKIEQLKHPQKKGARGRVVDGPTDADIGRLSEYQKKKSALDKAKEEEEAEIKAEAEKKSGKDMPRQENGRLYATNSRLVKKVFLGHWGEVTDKDDLKGTSATAPKTYNFTKNILGKEFGATIDVWAARLLQRMVGGKRIPPEAETAVKGSLLTSGRTTGQFGFGQAVFEELARLVTDDKDHKWISTDPEKGILGLHGVTPADLQAMAWFLEKKRWTRGGWTTLDGEGGSYEFEISTQGYPDQAEFEAVRSYLFRKDVRDAVASGAIENWSEKKKAEYRRNKELFDRVVGHYYPDRYNVGLSLETSGELQGVGNKPTNKEMQGIAAQLLEAVYRGDDAKRDQVLAARAMPTFGMYGGNREKSYDLEVPVRSGWNPMHLWRTVCRIAGNKAQDATYASRVLAPDENYNPLLHKPGIEVYFRESGQYDEEQLKPGYTGPKNNLTKTLEAIHAQGLTEYTLIRLPDKSDAAFLAEKPEIIGVRLLVIPEFDERWGIRSPVLKDGTIPADWKARPAEERLRWSDLTDEQLAEAVGWRGDELRDLADAIKANVPEATTSARFWYEVRTAFRNQYEDIVNGTEDLHLQGNAGKIVPTLSESGERSELQPDAGPAQGHRGGGALGEAGQAQGGPAENAEDTHRVPGGAGQPRRLSFGDYSTGPGLAAARRWADDPRSLSYEKRQAGGIDPFRDSLSVEGTFKQRAGDRDIKGAYNPAEGTIRFTRFADLSTFAHEHAHHYLNCLMKFGVNSRYDYIRDDIRTLLDLWHIGNGSMTLEERLQIWEGLGVEGQRKFHEEFASHFEIYLSEGKAPTKGLAGVFQRIGEWLRALYHNAVSQEVGERYKAEIGEELAPLSDEVRTVLGHMFQTQDEAAAARRVRAPRIPQPVVAAARVLQVEEAADQKAAAPLGGPADPLSVAAGRQALMKAADDINSGRPVDVSRELDDVPMNEKALTAFRKHLDRKIIEWKSENRFIPMPGLLGNMIGPIDENVARSVAENPDPGSLGFSRTGTVGDGAPMVAFGNVPAKTQGTASFIWVDGRKVPVVYAVVEAGRPRLPGRPGYGQKTRVVHAVARASELAGLHDAYANGTAGKYRSYLEKKLAPVLGIDTAAVKAMKRPVLVRWLPEDVLDPPFLRKLAQPQESPYGPPEPDPLATFQLIDPRVKAPAASYVKISPEAASAVEGFQKTEMDHAVARALGPGPYLDSIPGDYMMPAGRVPPGEESRAAAGSAAGKAAGAPAEASPVSHPEAPAGTPDAAFPGMETAGRAPVPDTDGTPPTVNPEAPAGTPEAAPPPRPETPPAGIDPAAVEVKRERAAMAAGDRADAARVATIIESDPERVVALEDEDGMIYEVKLADIAGEQDSILEKAGKSALAWLEGVTCMLRNGGLL